MIKDLTVVIPAYNEEKAIGDILSDLISCNKNLEIIVVDDGSIDNTSAVAKDKGVKVIRHPENIGYGAALKSGIRQASNEYILILDSDGQHRNFRDIELLYSYIKDYEMVVGARTKGCKGSLVRRMGKNLLRAVASFLVEKDIPDLNSGFRIIKKSIVEGYFHLLCNEFSFTSTLTLIMLKEGFQVKFVPIEVEKRQGRSTVKFIRHGLGALLFILCTIMLFNPLRVFIPISLVLFIFGLGRLIQGLTAGVDYTITAVIGIVSSVVIFTFGLLADQIASLRRERLKI